MLEGADWNSIDVESPFIGALIDLFCYKIVISPVTNFFEK